MLHNPWRLHTQYSRKSCKKIWGNWEKSWCVFFLHPKIIMIFCLIAGGAVLKWCHAPSSLHLHSSYFQDKRSLKTWNIIWFANPSPLSRNVMIPQPLTSFMDVPLKPFLLHSLSHSPRTIKIMVLSYDSQKLNFYLSIWLKKLFLT